MLIYVFPPHYQLVYINFDISSFSLISYKQKGHLLEARRAPFQIKKGISLSAYKLTLNSTYYLR